MRTLATLERAVLLGELGVLSKRHIVELDVRLRAVFGLWACDSGCKQKQRDSEESLLKTPPPMLMDRRYQYPFRATLSYCRSGSSDAPFRHTEAVDY